MTIKSKLLLLIFTATLLSCSKGIEDSAISGEIIVGLSSNNKVTTKSDDNKIAPGQDIEQYVVNIYKDGEPYAGWDTYSELPKGKKVRLAFGTYLLSSYWGSNRAAAFDAPFYYGEEEFTLTEKDVVVPVELTCKLANVKLDIKYTDLFRDITLRDFTSFRIDIYTDYTAAPLMFESNETRTAYLRESKIMLRLVLTKPDGMEYDYGFDHIEGVKAQDHYTVTVDYSSSQQAGFKITINEETKELLSQFDFKFEDMVKKEPTVKLSFKDVYEFLSSDVILKNAPQKEILLAYAHCDSRIKDIIFKSDAEFAAEKGIPTEISFKDLLSNSTLSNKLKSLGFEWNEIIGSKDGIIRFTDITSSMIVPGVVPHDYSFEVTTIDYLDRSTSKPFTLRVIPPTFTIPETLPGYIWSKEATLQEMTINEFPYDVMDKSNILYEISTDGSSWTTITPAEGKVTAKALTANTSYKVRSKYGKYLSSNIYSFTTESTPSVENANMDSWWNTYVFGDDGWLSRSVNEWFAGVSPERTPYWGTRNPQTTSQRSGTCAFYTSNSGTRNVGGRSGQAAEIATVGWGEGSTYVNSLSTSVVKNITTGNLFMGTCDASGNIDLGRAFTSRPTHLKFWYKYAPINNNKFVAEIVVQHREEGSLITTTIGSGSVISGNSVGSFTESTVEITYDPQYAHLKATHMYINFASREGNNSSKDDIRAIKGSANAFSGFRDSMYKGSVLTVDDISLVYEK